MEIHQKAEQSSLFVSIGTSKGEVYPATVAVEEFKDLIINNIK